MFSFSTLPPHAPVIARLWAWLILFPCFASLFPVTSAHSGNYNFNESWRWAHFTTESGLPSNRIIQILDSKDSQPWVMTSSGLAWFDGFQWNVIDSKAGLSCGEPMRIVGMVNDSVVIQCGNQLFIGTTGGFRKMMTIDQQTAATAGGELLLLKNGKLDIHPAEKNPFLEELRMHTIRGVWATSYDRLWVSTNDGLFITDGNTVALKLRITRGAIGISSAAENEKGTGLVSISYPFSKRGLWEWSKELTPRLVAGERAAVARILDVGPEGEAIVSYHVDDVRFRRAGKWETVSFPPRDITFFQFRANGDLWVGTNQGLFLFNAAPSRWATNRFPSPDPRNSINAIITTRNGDVWFGTGDGVVIQKPGGELRTITNVLGTRLFVVTGLGEDSLGNVWISSGSSFTGAFRWDGSNWFRGEADTPTDRVRFHGIEKDQRGDLWFLGTDEDENRQPPLSPAIYTLADGRLRYWARTPDLPNARVYSFAGISDDEKWFGTFQGLFHLKGGLWKHYTIREGLKNDRVFTLAVDRNRRVWFGHATTPTETGLGYIDSDDSVRYFSIADGLVNNHIWDISLDSSGTIWLGTAGGVASYRDGKWTRGDGQGGIPHPSVWPVLPVSGKLYAGTQGGGVSILDLNHRVLPPPRVVAQKAVVEGNSVLVRWNAFAFWGELDPDQILTRYRTKTSGWSGWNITSSVTLSGLHAGTHSVQIQAQGLGGTVDPDGATVSFVVLEPLFLRPYILWPGLVLILLSISMAVNQFVRKQRYAEELKRSEAKFRAVAQLTQSAIVIHDVQKILFANKGMESLTGWDLNELVDMSFSSLIHPDDRHAYDRLLALQDSSQHSRELRLVKKDGEARWIDLTWGPVQFRDVSAFLSTAFDVTERKDAETRIRDQHRRLRELTSEISVMEERERRRMAVHLHDVIGQNLALGKMRIRLLEKRSSIKPEDLKDIREIIEEAIHQTRSLTLELSPPILYTLELPAAVQSLAGLIFDKQGITVNVVCKGNSPHLDDDVRAIFFSAIRELFVNIVKHAGASSVEVELQTFDATLQAVIRDNGKGIGESKKPSTGFGLFNIRERFEFFGGTIDVCSPPGEGTTFTLVVPLRHITPTTAVTEKDHVDSHSPRG